MVMSLTTPDKTEPTFRFYVLYDKIRGCSARRHGLPFAAARARPVLPDPA